MGSSRNRAAEEAQRQEQQRMAAIAATQGRINAVFDDPRRAQDIAQARTGLQDYLTRDLNEQKGINDRQLAFALARNGQIGGSVQVDRQAQFGRDYSKGLLEVDRRARGFGAELEAADQDARGRLIQLATTGLDATTAATQAAASMRSSLEATRSSAQAQGLGDLFGGVRTFADESKRAATNRRADQRAFGSLYGGSWGYGGSGAAWGGR